MTVDGVANTVEEVDVVAVEDRRRQPVRQRLHDPHDGDRARGRRRPARRRRALADVAHREHAPAATTSASPSATSCVPSSNPVLLARPGSSVAKRAAFATRHLWVTRYDPAERYAAGDYPNQHAGGAGLPAFQRPTAASSTRTSSCGTRSARRTSRAPRTGRSCRSSTSGSRSSRSNFFDRNPALDLPRSSPGAECSVETAGQRSSPRTADRQASPNGTSLHSGRCRTARLGVCSVTAERSG